LRWRPAAPAGAASCKTVKCLQKQVNTLTKDMAVTTGEFKRPSECLKDIPITEFGNPSSSYGYDYSTPSGTVLTYGLQRTPSGQKVSAWVLEDACNPKTTASIRAAAPTAGIGLSPIGHMPALIKTFPFRG
jgi:hypothetical protein